MARFFKRFFLALGSLLLLIYLALYLFQDLLIFQSVALEKSHAYKFSTPFEEYFIPVPNPDQTYDTLNALWFHPDSVPRGLILYFHGNRGNLERWGNYAPELVRHGYDVVMVDYRGYGKSTGKPSEETLYRDADAVYDWVRAHLVQGKLVLYGRSLGSAVASHLAMHVPHDLLILETPFDELRGVMNPYFDSAARLLPLRHEFSNYENLESVKSRVIILHGTEDAVVPLRSAERLKPLLRSADDFIIIPKGTHRNLGTFPEYHQALDRVLP